MSAMTAPELADTSAPPTPWSTRNPMIAASFQDSAHKAEPTTKTTNPASYMRTRPKRSPSLPTWVASSVIVKRYPITTQITELRATCSARWISGKASTTMVVSTAAMSTPAMMTAKASCG